MSSIMHTAVTDNPAYITTSKPNSVFNIIIYVVNLCYALCNAG